MNRTLPLLLLTLLLGGCDLLTPEPPTYTVVRGDTLSKIAKVHGCTVDDLRTWNGISGDLIEVGQVLVVGEGGDAPPEATAPAAPARTRKRRSARKTTLAPAAAPDGAPALTLPAEKPCLAGPEEAEEQGMEAGFAASRGLDGGQVSAALAAFEPNLVRCLQPGSGAAGTADLELTVACTGRVSAVSVIDDGGLPAELVGCVRETLRYAAFPAHDMPDGFTFGYPVTVSP
jgi:murein DD-endopeptidase MepM/ murein hydrolase activator NlpD